MSESKLKRAFKARFGVMVAAFQQYFGFLPNQARKSMH
jgi:AraC-like DNA-binding protein